MTPFLWNGETMTPLRLRQAQATYVAGRIYMLDEVAERSWNSHTHQFAWIAEAWRNLPEELSAAFPSPEHLRHAALIATGWSRDRIIDCGSRETAAEVACFIKEREPFASVIVGDETVTVRTARSQAMRGPNRMSRKEFQDSKTAILDWIAALIGVSPEELKQARSA